MVFILFCYAKISCTDKKRNFVLYNLIHNLPISIVAAFIAEFLFGIISKRSKYVKFYLKFLFCLSTICVYIIDVLI